MADWLVVDDERVAGLPWPGEELAARVSGTTDREAFLASGRRSVDDIERALAVTGHSLDSFERILDFGCGSGRILVWLRELGKRAELHGVDIDGRAIAWVSENLPWVTARVNQARPPLDVPDGFFDLIYNHSVFTHIDESYQDEWLTELQRVTPAGGIVLLSVHGDHVVNEVAGASAAGGGDPSSVRRQLAEHGIVFLADDAWVGGPFPDFYHTTLHAPWYVFAHWSRWFTIRAYLHAGHSTTRTWWCSSGGPTASRRPRRSFPLAVGRADRLASRRPRHLGHRCGERAAARRSRCALGHQQGSGGAGRSPGRPARAPALRRPPAGRRGGDARCPACS